MEQQHAVLVKAVRGKTILVVVRSDLSSRFSLHSDRARLQCDDLWSADHFNCLDIVDTSTSAKALISSRIRGVLSNSTEVMLSLFTIAESVEVYVLCWFVSLTVVVGSS